VNGSDVPALTGNYYLNSLLLGGGITPNDYFQQSSAGLAGGFNQAIVAGDSSSIVVNGVSYGLSINGVPRGTYQYTTTGSSSITIDGQTIFFAPYEKGGIQNGVPLKVTDASDGGHIDTFFDTANLQPWFKNAFAYDSGDRPKGIDTTNDDGSGKDTLFDPDNTHPYDKLDVTKGTDGKITTAQVALDPTLLSAGATIGQIFGSELGAALGGKDQLSKLAGSAVGGAIGSLVAQKFIQVLATSMTVDLSQVSLNDVFAGQDVSVANAGIGAISAFLTAELGSALKIDGFGGKLFNAAANGFTVSVLSQVTSKIQAGLSFDAAIGAIDWGQSVTGAIDVARLNLDGILGGYLGHELVPAKTHEGAVGGALFGAIGNLILPGGLGSLIGTILGTLIGNQFGTTPSPGAVDLLDQAGRFYGYRPYQYSDQGSYEPSEKMAKAAADIVNMYLDAVDGVVLDHSKQVTVGYIKNPGLLYIKGTPGHTDRSFTSADDAVHAAALDVLQNIEVIGGDLLLKRAHQNSPSNIPEPLPSGIPVVSQVSVASQLVTMAGDLSVAQDYENYLNNREAINALMAANPESAFTAGWIATFARVNDLKLNQVNKNDFLGGLVGWVDSVKKAGLGAEAANASVKLDSGGKVTVDLKVANGTEVPGALSVFADQVSQSSDASGTTVHFSFGNTLAAGGYDLRSGAIAGDGSNDLWFAGNGANNFTGTAGHDILIGNAAANIIEAGSGFDFVDGGDGNDWLYGQYGNDILRGGPGADYLAGGQGDDTYVYNRGDGADTMRDTYTLMGQQQNAGADTLVFGPGIRVSDISVYFSGNDLIVQVKDPAHPGAAPTDVITLQNWGDFSDRIETFAFADGTTADIGGQYMAYKVPFGAALSGSSVAENSANGTVVGTVAGFDFLYGAGLTYAFADSAASAGGRFAINASTGVITVAAAIDYEATASHAFDIKVRIADAGGHSIEKPFSIAVSDAAPIVGGSGNDHITGTAVGDIIDGGAGNDILTGGTGSDRFIFRHGSGADIITDFAAGAGSDDKLDLTAFASSYNLAYVLAHTTQSGANTVIDLGSGDSITLQNVAKANLSGSDFVGMEAFTYGGIWTPAGSGSDNTWHVGDFNGDGKDDIFRYLSDSGEQVFVSTGSGFAYSGVWSGAGNGSDGKWHVGDFNGDGKDDAFRFIDGIGDQMFLSSGSSFYYNGVWSQAGAGTDGTWHVGDFNGDGKADVFRYLNGEDVFLSNGSSFGNESMWLTAGAGSDGKWYVGDFNGDGKSDIFRALGGTGNQVFLSTGSSFAYGDVWTPAGVGTDGTWHVGDFNGDGKDDIFRYVAGQSGADVFLSNGMAFVYDTSWTGAGIGIDNQWYVGDFTGGGADDIFRYITGVGMFPSAFG
jgi:hypothetical protein